MELYDALIYAVIALTLLAFLLILAIAYNEVKIAQAFNRKTKRHKDRIIDVWGNHQAHVQVSGKFYLDNLLPK